MAVPEIKSYDKQDGFLCLPYPRLAEEFFISGTERVHVLTDNDLFNACGTRIAFSFRDGGVSSPPFDSMNLSVDIGDNEGDVARNRRILLDALGTGSDFEYLVNPKQIHGDRVIEIDDSVNLSNLQKGPREEADGVVCTLSNIPSLLVFADCVPVILVAPNGMYSILHAGWRGAIASVPAIGLEKLARAVNCSPSEINCYIGPHIGSCCYKVDSDLLKRFVREFGNACDAGESMLDLTEAVMSSLLRAGALQERIVESGICTSCRTDLLYSYRADSGVTGRHGAFAYRKERE